MQLFEHDRNNAHSQPILGDVVEQFFAPVQFDALTQLASEYQRLKARITEVHGILTEEKVSGVMGYFFSGNSSDQYCHSAALRHTSAFNEIFWSRALNLSDLQEHMPQARRNQWHECLNAWRARLPARRQSRAGHARVQPRQPARHDPGTHGPAGGIPRRAGRRHLPQSLALARHQHLGRLRQADDPEPHLFAVDHDREGYIHDLRMVIAKFMGRDDPRRDTTTRLLNLARAHRGLRQPAGARLQGGHGASGGASGPGLAPEWHPRLPAPHGHTGERPHPAPACEGRRLQEQGALRPADL